MEPLEVILKKIEDLREELSREIKREVEGHWEEQSVGPSLDSRWTWGSTPIDTGETERVYVPQQTVTEPDTGKRKAARQELQQIYGSSEWYSARYVAAKTLNKHYEPCEDMVNWLKQLRSQLHAVRTESRTIRYRHSDGESDKEFEIVDQEQRIHAVRDLGQLAKRCKCSPVRNTLKQEYNIGWHDRLEFEDVNEYGKRVDTGFKARMMKEVGKALGYSGLRVGTHIWMKQHRIF